MNRIIIPSEKLGTHWGMSARPYRFRGIVTYCVSGGRRRMTDRRRRLVRFRPRRAAPRRCDRRRHAGPARMRPAGGPCPFKIRRSGAAYVVYFSGSAERSRRPSETPERLGGEEEGSGVTNDHCPLIIVQCCRVGAKFTLLSMWLAVRSANASRTEILLTC